MTVEEPVVAMAADLKVRAHPGLCEGWGNCHRWAPEVYPLDDDGHIAIHLLAVPEELAAAAWAGAQVCPARAISVDGPRPDTTTSGA
jgi:ferredoxin